MSRKKERIPSIYQEVTKQVSYFNLYSLLLKLYFFVIHFSLGMTWSCHLPIVFFFLWALYMLKISIVCDKHSPWILELVILTCIYPVLGLSFLWYFLDFSCLHLGRLTIVAHCKHLPSRRSALEETKLLSRSN